MLKMHKSYQLRLFPMNSSIKAYLYRATPYAMYLSGYFIFCGVWLLITEKINANLNMLMGFMIIGGSLGAFVSFWRLALAFIPDAKFPVTSNEYIEVSSMPDKRCFTELLLDYSRQLQRIAYSYEKQRQKLTKIGVTVGIASLTVPIATWIVILLDAFSEKESMPNAWLLVVSSSTTGLLGLAISVTLLRHLKNNQKPHGEISRRLMLCIETNIAINASDGSQEVRDKAFATALISFVQTPSLAATSKLGQEDDNDKDNDSKLIASFLSFLRSQNSL